MIHSEQISELVKALALAQAEMRGAEKTSENPFFNSSYADLASCWEACRIPLSKNGLCVIQTTSEQASGICIETMLAHSSGQWFRSILPIKATKQDPQGIGSAITYARRYALMAIVGIAPQDDDGNDASGKGKETDKEPKGAKVAPKQGTPPKIQPNAGATATPAKTITQDQIKRLFAIQHESSWTEADVKAFIQEQFALESRKDLTQENYNILCDAIQAGDPPENLEAG